MKLNRSKSEMRLIRQATAYKRLMWKRGTSTRQREMWQRTIDRLEREAEAIYQRRLREAEAKKLS